MIFTVTNKGKVSHDFKIAGKKTPLLAPGRSATLRVTFSKKGRYPYLSTVSGQASPGMKGVFSVVARAHAHAHHHNRPAPHHDRPVRPADRAGRYGQHDGHRRTVRRPHDPGYIVLSQTTIPSGMVTFVITNKCRRSLQLRPRGHQGGRDTQHTGESETWTVALPPGIYRYHCDVEPIDMKGSFTVTP